MAVARRLILPTAVVLALVAAGLALALSRHGATGGQAEPTVSSPTPAAAVVSTPAPVRPAPAIHAAPQADQENENGNDDQAGDDRSTGDGGDDQAGDDAGGNQP